MPKISVILSAYNAEKFIAESIESVLNQTFTDFEFLIVEDNSTDNTLKIIESYQKLDSRILLTKKNQNKGFIGYVENLNMMIEQAKGDYIAKFDADDIWEKDKLEKQIEDIESNPEIFLLSANAIKIDENGNEIGKVIYPYKLNETNKMILHTNPFCHPSILFRNQGYNYREKMYYAEDYDLYLRMFSDKKVLVHRKEFLFKYRILDSSISRNNKGLIQALFKQKIIEFYYQRVMYGKDEYNDFEPKDYLEILNKDYPNSIKDLKQALRNAFIGNWKPEFKILFRKAIKQYNIFIFFKFSLIYLFYDLCYLLYKKIK